MGNFQTTNELTRFPLKCRKVKKYGYIPDIPDARDIYISFPKQINSLSSVDLRKGDLMPEIDNQGNLGSSVAHAIIAAYLYDLNKSGIKNINPSRQFIYYNQRLVSGTTEFDSGASIRDGIKVLNRLGTCPTEMYQYDPNFFTDKPSEDAYKNAYKYKHVIQYKKVRIVLEDIMKIISIKIPIILGFTVYESFEHPDVARTGIMPLPKFGEKIVGAHSVLIVGYDSSRNYLLCRNSWGTSWGQEGYFWMPFAFINSRNCSDLWILSTGTNVKPSERMVEKIPERLPRKSEKNVEDTIIIEKIPEFKEDDLSIDDIEEDINAL